MFFVVKTCFFVIKEKQFNKSVFTDNFLKCITVVCKTKIKNVYLPISSIV